jgi:hypothetical protein
MGTLATAAACAARATSWLERQAPLEHAAAPGADFARRCHVLRNRLASLQAALDVAALTAPGSDIAREAHAIAARQSASVAAILDELQGAAWAAR